MKTYQIHQIGNNKGAPRVWLEGRQPERAGFSPGRRYEVKAIAERNMVVLKLCETGSHIVVRKERKGEDVPVIDINSHRWLGMFHGMQAIRVVIRDNEIYLMPLASESRKRSRIETLKSKLQNNKPITVGSLSHGGGVLSNAVHRGLHQAGISSKLVFANDIRDELLEQASSKNEAWDADTQYLSAPLQELAFDVYAMNQLPQVDLLECGLPCSGASVAGRAKKKTSIPEEHDQVGHLIAAAIAIMAKVNPCGILFENVVPYASSASMAILRTQLRDLGYVVKEVVLEGKDWNCLENRKRLCMVAMTEGIEFDFDALLKPEPIERNLGEILEDIPESDSRWSRMEGLKAKEIRDKEAGKGFAMQIYGEEDTSIGTLTKGLAKNRSTDPKIKCKTNPDLLRIPTPAEHAKCKDIPPHLVEGLSNTLAHEVLGQSIVFPPFVSVAETIGKALLAWCHQSMPLKPILPELELLQAA